MSTDAFSLDVKWEATNEPPSEIGATTGRITMEINGWAATGNYDVFSATRKDHALVSAYPMALWFAYNWWRILYEPLPIGNYENPPTGWREAHDLPSAGDGFAWPPLRFISTGPMIFVTRYRSSGLSVSNSRYDTNGYGYVPTDLFIKIVSSFIEKVIARLVNTEHEATELQILWKEVQEESRDKEANLYRTVESCLGFDPEDGPKDLIISLAGKVRDAGEDAIIEIAAALSAESAVSGNGEYEKILTINGNGLAGRFCAYDTFPPGDFTLRERPWNAGHALARDLRRHIGLGSAPISTDKLAGLFSIKKADLPNSPADLPLRMFSLGVPRKDDPERLSIYLHLATENGQRFYLARILGERLLNRKTPERWLPATYAKTWRQKFQRAFAAEFLCPLEVLRDRLTNDSEEDSLAATAKDYGLDTRSLMNNWLVNSPRRSWLEQTEFAEYDL